MLRAAPVMYETGFWPAAVVVFKFTANVGAWLAADWAIGELFSGAEDATEEQGSEAAEPVTEGYRQLSLQQLDNLQTRGNVMLSGPPLAIYTKMVQEAREAMNEPGLTMADAAAFRTMLFRYTYKHGNCDAFPAESEVCENYKIKWPGKVTPTPAKVPGKPGKPSLQDKPILAGKKQSNVLPYVALGAAALVVFYLVK